jgi:hypothetical protein
MSGGARSRRCFGKKLDIAFAIRPTFWGGWFFAKPVFRDISAHAD